ncbi:MAG: hypothetical protein RL220_1828, partial [Bacteroidota bacterium]
MRCFLYITVFLACFIGNAEAQTRSSLADDRDGKSYPIVLIGNRWWFAENLNYQTARSHSFAESKGSESWGRLYDVSEMRGACPPGWRVPDLRDWASLKT